MLCAESLRVQAYVDGELDAPGSLAVEQHLEHCVPCKALRSELEALRSGLRRELRGVRAPPRLRLRVQQALDDAQDAAPDAAPAGRDESPARPGAASPRGTGWRVPAFWRGALGGFAAAAAVATAVLFVRLPGGAAPVVDAVLGAHVAALMSSRPYEVESSDHHTVKPWFAGRVDVSPAVADFAAQGFRLVGGRVDLLGRQRAAVLVYRHGAHVASVYCWPAPAGPLPGNVTRRGYHLAFWRERDLAYAAVSDTGWDELLALERLVEGVDGVDPPAAAGG